MGSSSQGITLEQIGQVYTTQAIGNTPGIQLFDSSHGTTAQVDSTKKTSDVLNCLMALPSAHSLDALLYSLADLTRQVMKMDLCIVMLVDPTYGSLTMRAASPDLSDYEISFAAIETDRIPWKKLLLFNTEGHLPTLTIHEQELLNPLKQVEYETLLVVPLVIGNEYLGLLTCYSSKIRDYTFEDLVLLRTITSQGALTIQNRQFEHTPESNGMHPYIKSFFDDLLSGRPYTEESLRGRANYLGCDLTKPHSMLIIEILPSEPADASRSRDQAALQARIPTTLPSEPADASRSRDQAALQARIPTTLPSEPADASRSRDLFGGNQYIAYKQAAQFIKYRLQEHYPGTLVDQRENRLFCIIPLDRAGDVQHWLCDLLHLGQLEQHIRIFFGIGNTYLDIRDYSKGFTEAEEALRIGQHLKSEGGGIHFNDLGINRYIYDFARSNKMDDLYLEKIAAITGYDQQRKGSELLDTLEVFLEVGGNIKDASERLQVHRNTIIQRLKHIQSLGAIDLDQPDQRLRLQVALMIDKLRKN
jgi:sugar diacid utilization regulator